VTQMDFRNFCSLLGLSRISVQIIVSHSGEEGRFGSWRGDLVGLGRWGNGEVAFRS
jgi:hypothetical protein